MNFLLFQTYAPMVSWGEIAVGGERQSARHPSKSAIIGLVSAAMGIKREDEQSLNALAKSLGVAVQLHSSGSVLKDFHTAQVPKKENKVVHHTRKAELLAPSDKIGTILSRREYRCDAYSVIAIYLKSDCGDLSLEKIQKSLCKPVFHLYFGRKSSPPALPLAPVLVQSDTLREAFNKYKSNFVTPIDDSSPEWLQKAFKEYPNNTLFEDTISYFWENGMTAGFDNKSVITIERYDQPTSRKRWQFTSRSENMAMIKREEATNVS